MAVGNDFSDGTYIVSELTNTYKITINGKAPTAGSVTISGGKVVSYSLQEEGYTITKYVGSDNTYATKTSTYVDHIQIQY